MSSSVTRSLYRSLLRRAKRIDQSPVAKCFVVAKPREIYLHDFDATVPLKMEGDEGAVETFLREYNGGQFYVPEISSGKSPDQISLYSRIQSIFRDGFPKDLERKLTENGQELTDVRRLQLGFMMFRRLSFFVHLADRAQKKPTKDVVDIPSSLTPTNVPSETSPTTPELSSFERQEQIIEALPKLSLTSLRSVSTASIRAGDLEFSPGLILIAHPLSCFGQTSLKGRVIFLTEVGNSGARGLVLNNSWKQNRPKPRLGEYSYLGGPVHDETMYILHDSPECSNEFKSSTGTMVGDPANGLSNVYLTELGSEKRSHFEKFWKRYNATISGQSLAGSSANLDAPDSQMDPYAESSSPPIQQISEEKKPDENSKRGTFKFVYQSATWDLRQLRCEIENGVWFVAYVSDPQEMADLLLSTVPEYRPTTKSTPPPVSTGKLRTRQPSQPTTGGVTATDLTQAYNLSMWRDFMKAIGGEHAELAHFPTFDEALSKEYEDFLSGFYRQVFEDALKTAMT